VLDITIVVYRTIYILNIRWLCPGVARHSRRRSYVKVW